MNRRREWLWGSIALAALGACSRKEPPIQADKPAVDEPAPEAPAPTASAKAPVAPAPPPERRIAEVELPLSLFDGNPAEHSYERDRRYLFSVGGKMVVVPTFATLVDGALEAPGEGFDFYDFPGEDSRGEVVGANWFTASRVMGRYPDELWVASEGSYGLIAPRTFYSMDHSYVHQRQYGHWGRVQDRPVAAAPWSSGRTLAYLDVNEFKLARPLKGKLGELPKQQPGKSRLARVDGGAMTALPSGEVFVLGADVDADDQLTLERWDEGGGDGQALANSRLIPLPVPPGRAKGYWLTANRQVAYAAVNTDEGPHLIEIRGEVATPLNCPVQRVRDIQLTQDGALFIHGDGVLYRYDGRRDGADQFTRAALPASMKIKEQTGIFAESKDYVYLGVVTEGKEASLILSTRPARAPIAPPALSASAAAAVSGDDLLAAFPAAGAECATPFVVLFPVASSTPRDFKFPQTQRILREFNDRARLKVVDFDHRGARFVGVVAPDSKTMEALVQHWNARDEKSKSRPACFAPPEGAREVKIQ